MVHAQKGEPEDLVGKKGKKKDSNFGRGGEKKKIKRLYQPCRTTKKKDARSRGVAKSTAPVRRKGN